MNFGIIAESGKRYGLGNLHRCLSIAKILKNKGHKVYFITSTQSSKSIITDYGFQYVYLKQKDKDKEINTLLKKLEINTLVIDSKKNNIIIFKIIKKKIKIVLIDNKKYTDHGDLVIFPGPKEQFTNHPKKCMIGPNYIILTPNFKKIKKTKLKKSFFISMGGGDKYNITKKIILKLKHTKIDFTVFVILGKFYSDPEKIKKILKNDKRFTVIHNVNNFHEIMAKCQFGVITFGVTVFEAAALNIPTLVISHSNENHFSARRLEKYGWYDYLGKYDKICYSDIIKNVISNIKNKPKLKIKERNLIDSKGAERISKKILELDA